jgi:penicillin G amidase
MRTRILAAVCVIFITACSGSETSTTLSVSPSGAQTISGPTLITASPADLASEVTWSLSGPGSLSGTTGQSVVYRPPVPADPSPATVTASARGQSATVTFTGQTPQQALHTISGLTAAVDVTYDQFDIPHIFCANQNDCYAAQGYIQAQDRLFQMDLFRRTAEGRAAELVGSVLINQDKQFLALFSTRDGLRIEDKLVAALDDATRAKLDAFTKGVNAYLAFLKQNPTLMPQEYAQISAGITPADIPDWTPADTLALGRLQQFQLSETISEETAYGLFALTFAQGPLAEPGRVNAYIRPVQPLQAFTLAPSDSISIPSAPGGGAQPAVAAASAWAPGLAEIHGQMEALHGAFGPLSADPGSNNWVVDAAHSATGHAMVANDPHLALQYPPLFHLAAMTASDGSGLNVAGGSFPGVPGALIGRGKHVGWGVRRGL